MRLTRLQLFDYRNFHRLDIPLSARVAIFVGDNAQGKSNLLEAVHLAATTRGLRAETDVQLVNRDVLPEVLPAARVVAQAGTKDGPLKVEVVVTVRAGAHGPVATKTVKVNGVSRRLSDAQGQLMAVLFAAEDMELISGPPSLRRRYVDVTLAQVDREYASSRSRYERLVTQRNHLLKRIREGSARFDELEYWDTELARDGGVLIARRARALAVLGDLAARSHAALAPGEELRATYVPRLAAPVSPGVDASEAGDALLRALQQGVKGDVAAGMTLLGPHRDDLLLELNGASASGFASRAQQRTIALSLRLAEAAYLERERGEPPVLLMDDVLSEMDAGRREGVLGALAGVDQMLVTGTDWDRFPLSFTAGAQLFTVCGGNVTPVAPQASLRTGTS